MNERIVIYTAIFGGCDGLLPQKKIRGVDYICFTDSERHASPWSVRIMKPQYHDPVRSAKIYKILPHRFLPDHDISIWIDGNFIVERDIRPLIGSVLVKHNMAMFDHNATKDDRRDCLYSEYDSIVRLSEKSGKLMDDPAVMKQQVERYRKEGYPEHNGLISGGVLIRRHHAKDAARTMERWWSEIENGSRRDQLSCNYAVWKENTSYSVIEDNIRDNRWFYMIGVHRSDYRGKLLRYRLRRLLGLRKPH